MLALSQRSRHNLNRFKRQYLQLQADPTYPSSKDLREEAFQQALFEEIFREHATQYQPPDRYQLRVLKELMRRVEASIEDWEEEGISDDLMSRLSFLLCSPLPSEGASAQQKAYVNYTISSLATDKIPEPTITLLEARSLVAAGGTTGLRTWEACLHLATYLCSSDCALSLHNNFVLELGSGTGYLSVLCAKYLGAAHVTASDGADTVVSDLQTNFYLNGLEGDNKITAKELPWGQPLIGDEQPEWNHGRPIDVVIGADVTYDKKTIPALIATLSDVLELSPHCDIIIAATIRNEDTFDIFLAACRSNDFAVKELPYAIPKAEDQEGPFYSDAIPIKICKITKSSQS